MALRQHTDTITDLLLGAAYADKRLEGEELTAIRTMIARLVGTVTVPSRIEDRIRAFNPAKHDIAAATGSLKDLGADDKKTVIELVASVNDSDDELDFDEDAYLRKVASGLGLSDDEIAGLTLEIIESGKQDGLLKG
ncbi:MAG: TerB family tellurite resistance protein [Myxococcota bacterium]